MAKHRRERETPVSYGTAYVSVAVAAGVIIIYLVRRVRAR